MLDRPGGPTTLALSRSFARAPRLETARLILRAHGAHDLPAVAAMWPDAAVVRHISGRPSTREECWARILRYAGLWPITGYGYWAAEEGDRPLPGRRRPRRLCPGALPSDLRRTGGRLGSHPFGARQGLRDRSDAGCPSLGGQDLGRAAGDLHAGRGERGLTQRRAQVRLPRARARRSQGVGRAGLGTASRWLRYAVPGSRGASLTREGEDAPWRQVFTAQPARRREFEPVGRAAFNQAAQAPTRALAPATG
jgi:hypothetical protein